jgi:hypothetical protein
MSLKPPYPRLRCGNMVGGIVDRRRRPAHDDGQTSTLGRLRCLSGMDGQSRRMLSLLFITMIAGRDNRSRRRRRRR